MSKVKVGDWVFDTSDYDAENDVLYLTIGEPRPGHGEETPEGHIARFDEEGEFCGLTLLDVRAQMDKGSFRVTLPRRYFPRTESVEPYKLRSILC